MELYVITYLKTRLKKLLRSIANAALEERFGDQRTSPAVQASQRHLFNYYQNLAATGALPPLSDTGFRVFSQFEEDGKLLCLFAGLGTHNRTFVDVGSGNCTNSNCANLALNFGWHGLFIDGNEHNITAGRQYYKMHPDSLAFPPRFVSAMVARENINELIRGAGFEGNVDLLSIDIDGNDYWVWDAIDCITPNVVIIETQVEFGMKSIVVPYDKDYVFPGRHEQYHGASPVAMEKLARKKGYRLVGANNYGFNTIYVKNGIGEDLFPEVSVESILKHPRNPVRHQLFDEIRDFEYLEV